MLSNFFPMSILSRLNTKKYAFYSEFQYSSNSLFFFSCSSCDIRLCDVELLAVTGFSVSFFGVTLALLNNPAIALCGVSTLLLLFPIFSCDNGTGTNFVVVRWGVGRHIIISWTRDSWDNFFLFFLSPISISSFIDSHLFLCVTK